MASSYEEGSKKKRNVAIPAPKLSLLPQLQIRIFIILVWIISDLLVENCFHRVYKGDPYIPDPIAIERIARPTSHFVAFLRFQQDRMVDEKNRYTPSCKTRFLGR